MCTLDKMVLILIVILLGGVISMVCGFRIIAFLIMAMFMVATFITLIIAYIKLMR